MEEAVCIQALMSFCKIKGDELGEGVGSRFQCVAIWILHRSYKSTPWTVYEMLTYHSNESFI